MMDSNLQEKLQQFSANPPEGCWSKIADALDSTGNYSERLYQYEATPPATVWAAVEAGLSQPATAKVVPMAGHFGKQARYAVAVALLAMAALVVFFTMPANPNRDVARIEKPRAMNNTASSKNTVRTNTAVSAPPFAAQQPATGKTANLRNTVFGDRQKTRTVAVAPQEPEPADDANDADFSSLKEYVFFSDGDGKVRKVSKKLASFVNCKPNDANCQRHLKQLRQRLAANAMTTDFTGILEMLHQLQ